MVVKACNGTVGDRYSTTMCMLFALGSVKVLQATLMPLDANERVRVGCICLGIQIIVPPLLLPFCLSHLTAT